MPRFVIANRLAEGGDTDSERGRSAVLSTLGGLPAGAVHAKGPTGVERLLAVVDATFEDIEAARSVAPANLIIEPEVYFRPTGLCPADLVSSRGLATRAKPGPSPRRATVTVTGQGIGLPDVAVRLFLRFSGVVQHLDGTTDPTGTHEFDIPVGPEIAAVVASPRAGYWAMCSRGDAVHRVIECPPLPSDGPRAWWHDVVSGASALDPSSAPGDAVRIGVVDTGSGPHRNLRNVNDVGSFIQGVTTLGRAPDMDGHGTHVVGLIAAVPTLAGDYQGIAPGSVVYQAAVFGPGDELTTSGDLANAIDYLSQVCEVDLINLSLGGTDAPDVLRDAIKAAEARGTLCICAAGNGGGAVDYPAAFPESVAVAALGKAGWAPAGSLSDGSLPRDGKLFGQENLFAASFSANGDLIDCAAPGVGIVSTAMDPGAVSAHYVGMDGTSMACPIVTGTLAVLLSREATYLALPRDSRRTQVARSILKKCCRDAGLPSSHQGRGVPGV